MNRFVTSSIALFGAAALTACGGGPDVGQIRADFDNPSGSVNDSTGIVNAHAQAQVAGPAAGLGADPFTFIGGGDALTAAPSAGWSQVHAARVLSPYLNRQLAQLEAGQHSIRRFNLDEVDLDFSGCASQIERQVRGQAPEEGAKSVDLSVELDLSCVDGFSGTMSLDVKAEIDDDRIDYEMSASYDRVCYDETCVDGDIAFEFSLGANSQSASADMFGAWNFTLSTDGYTVTSKGGLRIAADSADGGSASIEYLFYVEDSEGNEVSYVIRADADAGSASLTIEGRDGSIVCTQNADGSGSCEGDLEWDAGELEEALRG